MATSSDALLLFLLMMCFYNPAFADSFNRNRTQTPTNLPSNHLEAHYSISNDTTNINILYFQIQNDMSTPGAVPYMYYMNADTPYYLKKGKPYTRLANLDRQSCRVYWDTKPITGPFYCAAFDVYDPRIDGNNHKMYWSVRNDGVYKSYDNSSWNKNKSWKTSTYTSSCN